MPVALLFLALSETGLYGTLEHFEERTGGGPPVQAGVSAQLVSDTGTPAGSGEFAGPRRGGSAPPWLAPLSVSGSALLGGAATLAGGKRNDGAVKGKLGAAT